MVFAGAKYDDLPNFDPGYMFTRMFDVKRRNPKINAAYDSRPFADPTFFEKRMESLAAFLSAKHTLELGQSSDLRPLTKYSSPPEIYIQKQFNLADKDG
eukprot:scaffold27380_cov36-Phaeocystis_antarctica.AAC.2